MTTGRQAERSVCQSVMTLAWPRPHTHTHAALTWVQVDVVPPLALFLGVVVDAMHERGLS